jgi:hypothetical protein
MMGDQFTLWPQQRPLYAAENGHSWLRTLMFAPSRTHARLPWQPPLCCVADQWEELYTLSRQEIARRRFMDELLEATAAGPLSVVLTLRGDFFGQVLSDRQLADRLQDAMVHLGPVAARRDIPAPPALDDREARLDVPPLAIGRAGTGEGALAAVALARQATGWPPCDGWNHALAAPVLSPPAAVGRGIVAVIGQPMRQGQPGQGVCHQGATLPMVPARPMVGHRAGARGGRALEQRDGLGQAPRQQARVNLVAAAPPPRGMVRHCAKPKGRAQVLGAGQQGFSTPIVHVHRCLQAATCQSRGRHIPLRGKGTGIVGHLGSRALHRQACQAASIMPFHGVSPPQPAI